MNMYIYIYVFVCVYIYNLSLSLFLGLWRDQELLQRHHAQQPRPDSLAEGGGRRAQEERGGEREAHVRDCAGKE